MIFLHDIPVLQVSSVTAVMIYSVVMDLKHKPFRDKNRNTMMAIVGSLFVIVNIGFCVLAFMNNSLKAKTKHNLVGNVLIASIASVFIVEMFFTGIDAYYGFKDTCFSKKKGKKKMKKLPTSD